MIEATDGGREMKKFGVVCCFVLAIMFGLSITPIFSRDFANPDRQEEADSDYYFEVIFFDRCRHKQSGQAGVCLFLFQRLKKLHLAIFFKDGRPQIILGKKPGEPVKELYISDWYGTF